MIDLITGLVFFQISQFFLMYAVRSWESDTGKNDLLLSQKKVPIFWNDNLITLYIFFFFMICQILVYLSAKLPPRFLKNAFFLLIVSFCEAQLGMTRVIV